MITVQEAENIVLTHSKHFGTESVAFQAALGRVLAEDILCDRDLPPYNRVTMDGIAIQYDSFAGGLRKFIIAGTQAAGDKPIEIATGNECVEIMTGAALPESVDTIIRYEDLLIDGNSATINIEDVKKGQNIHLKGKDNNKNDIAAPANTVIDAALISIAATVGKTHLLVKKLPSVVIISTGDELVDVNETPSSYQIRRSNSYTIQAALAPFCINADMLHVPDEKTTIATLLTHCLAHYDVIVLSGGVSMGKYDYLPAVLEELSVKMLFHKVKQRPGKPFWFGTNGQEKLVFAFPGNPVSAFLSLYRYFIPWLKKSLGIRWENNLVAELTEDVTFPAPLVYFMQVKISVSNTGQLLATPYQGNGSGDLSNLLHTDAFIALPLEENHFNKGSVYPILLYKNITY